MYKLLYVPIVLSIAVYSSDIVNYTDGLKYYQDHQYKKAYPIVLKEAKRGNKEAQYLLADMLEHGYGTKKDIKKSFDWYKASASTYHYVVEDEIAQKKEKPIDKENAFTQKRLQFAFSKLDLTSPDVKEEVTKMVNKNFGIYPHIIQTI